MSSEKEVARLVAAIQKHRDQRGDDRCYLDDAELYAAAGLQPANTALPPKEVFLGNCARFHASRQAPGDKYTTLAEQLSAFEKVVYSLTDLTYLRRNLVEKEALLKMEQVWEIAEQRLKAAKEALKT